jgi:hypothetical protein
MNQMACPKTGFSRRGFMIGIAGLSFAVAVDVKDLGTPRPRRLTLPERHSIHGSVSPPAAKYRSWHRLPKWGRDR